jgi:CubicO group peptidase (beta-lactamase class C family)
MRLFLAVCGLLLLIAAVSALPEDGNQISFTPSGPSDPAEVSSFLDTIMPATLAKYNVPGVTVAVVKDGRLVVAKGYGYSNLSGRVPVDADMTSFRIGSVTKLFTWTAVMQLVDEGKIDLDADVNTYLADMKIPDTYPGRPVTMRNLMTHTAGFEDTGLRMEGNDPQNLIPFRQYCKENIPARVFPPGKVSSYSNYGTTLAAVIVEDVSGMPFEEYLQSRILTPLGMDRTSIKEDLPPDLSANLSRGYTFTGKENTAAIPDDIFVIGPAGAITAPSPDIAKFMIAHLRNGTYNNASILSERAAGLMHARAFANDPRVSGMCLGFYEQYYNGLRAIAHDGDTTEFHSRLILIPEKQAGYFVSYNSAGGALARDEFFSAFMNHYYPAPQSLVPAADPANASLLQKYAGTYEMNRHNYARFEKVLSPLLQIGITVSGDGTLLTTTGKEYVEMSPGVFVRADGIREAQGDMVFHTAPDGTVDYLMSANSPTAVLDRIPWYATQGSLDNLKLAAGALLATVLIWPLLFLFRRTHGIPEPATGPARIARWTAGSAALILLGFVFVVVPAIVGDQTLVLSYYTEQAVPLSITLGMTVPVIAAILTLVTAAFAILAWKERYWTVINRVHYTVVTIALVAMLWWVNFWNLWVFCL